MINSANRLLKEYFGHDSFRPLQAKAIETILSKQDLLMILPTGGGKSICYQLPSLMMSGVTIVISPLLALMHDQVSSLRSANINARMFSSMQDSEEIKQIYKELFRGEVKLLYVSPERFLMDSFLELLSKIEINFFVIDEAHCLSEWGHEFREDYRRLDIIRKKFPDIPISAFTATATKSVRDDIISQLHLKKPQILKGKLYRENLKISVTHRRGDGKRQLIDFLSNQFGKSGIVYTLSRKQTETLAEYLQQMGFKAKAFHAGLENDIKKSVYEDFINDRIDIVVATIAFGMGIDKSNIRFVVHMSMPKTIENYYQEIGRAGRDGLDSVTLLLYSIEDAIMQKRFLEDIEDGVYKNSILDKIERMSHFVDSDICRHRDLALYFDDDIDACINKCDNCLKGEIKKVDITKEAQMLLSAIWRTKQRYGISYLTDILRGSKKSIVIERGDNNLSVYGIGKDLSKEQWRSISNRLLEVGAITQGEHKEFVITEFGAKILKGKKGIDISQDRISKQTRTKANVKTTSDSPLMTALKAKRKEIATEEMIPPYIVFNDKTLWDMSKKMPITKEEMLKVYGVGEVKFKKYGEAFLEVIRGYLGE